MTDLRKAADLALQALDIWEDGLTDPCANFGWRFACMGKEAQEALRQALAQPEQVLTARVVVSGSEHKPWCDSVTKLLLSMPPQIPPCNCKPKREWVGLTDEEMSELANKYKHIETGWYHDMDLIAEAEAKLKERNT